MIPVSSQSGLRLKPRLLLRKLLLLKWNLLRNGKFKFVHLKSSEISSVSLISQRFKFRLRKKVRAFRLLSRRRIVVLRVPKDRRCNRVRQNFVTRRFQTRWWGYGRVIQLLLTTKLWSRVLSLLSSGGLDGRCPRCRIKLACFSPFWRLIGSVLTDLRITLPIQLIVSCVIVTPLFIFLVVLRRLISRRRCDSTRVTLVLPFLTVRRQKLVV